MADYQEFKDSMQVLEDFIEKTETKEIEGEVHITIDDDNVEEFMEIIQNLISIATSDDNYVDGILEYLGELDQKITDRNMIAKFIPLYAALHAFALAANITKNSDEVQVDDWVFVLNAFDTPRATLDSAFGKIVDIAPSEDDATIKVVKIKTPSSNEIIEWEEGVFVPIKDMTMILKKYQDKYTKTF